MEHKLPLAASKKTESLQSCNSLRRVAKEPMTFSPHSGGLGFRAPASKSLQRHNAKPETKHNMSTFLGLGLGFFIESSKYPLTLCPEESCQCTPVIVGDIRPDNCGS